MRLKVALGFVAGLNLLAALAYQWIVLTTLGVGNATDALFAGLVIPQLVLSVVSGALVYVLTPILARESEEKLRETAWSSFLFVTGATAILAAVLFVGAPLWVRWLLPGFRSRDFDLAVSLTRIQLPGMVFAAAVAVPLAAWNARSRFLWPELAPLLTTLASILPLPVLLARLGVEAAAWLSTGKNLIFLLLVLPGLGAFHRPSWRSDGLREVRSRLKPLVGGNVYFKSDALVDRSLSSLAPPGELSILYLAQQLWNAASQVLTVGIGRPMFPALSTCAKEGRWLDYRRTLGRHVRPMLILVLVGIFAFAAAGRPVLVLLIGHGGVTAENVDYLWRVMLVLSGVFAGGCLGQLTSQAFYSIGDTRTPTRLSIVTFTLYVPLKFMAFRAFGLYGLASTSSVYLMVNLLLQAFVLNRRLRAKGGR